MLIIHGVDRYGRIDEVDGEYLVTRFFHLYLMPIVPLGSEWVTRRDADGLHGRTCRLSGRSVVAAYLRTWGVAVALVLLAAGVDLRDVRLVIAAGLLAGGVIATFVWRMDARERRRIAWHRGVLGIGLDPRRLRRSDAAGLLPEVEARFAEVSDGRTPLDVAQRGATSPAQALLAYTTLRVAAACTRGDRAASARAASERILDGCPKLDGGAPYRNAPPSEPAPTLPTLQAAVPLAPHRFAYRLATVGALCVLGCLAMMSRPRRYSCCGTGKAGIAGEMVRKLANESFPLWSLDHPHEQCPSLDDLARYANDPLIDPFGSLYRIRCEPGRIAVWSIGANRRDEGGLGDDVASW